jgi:hypothetical protein
MSACVRRVAIIVGTGLATSWCAAMVSPGVGAAAECGVGTVYDAPSNSCVVAMPVPPPPPPPPPPPAWNGDLTPYFSVGVCAPIPFVSLCTGI